MKVTKRPMPKGTTRVTLTFINGKEVSWPTLGFFRAWVLMLVLGPLNVAFWWCWLVVNVVRVAAAGMRSNSVWPYT